MSRRRAAVVIQIVPGRLARWIEELRLRGEKWRLDRVRPLSQNSRLGSKAGMARLQPARALPSPRTHYRKRRRVRQTASGRSFTYNLRFPGQYYQAETGLNYNYHRDYDPLSGRYVESDPLGLRGESYSTFTYVGDTPILLSDPFGLCPDGTHPATPEEIAKILNEANKLQKKGLSHAQIACNQFVNAAINAAFPGTVGAGINTTAMFQGLGPFTQVTTPDVGELVLFPDPGHVAFVTGVSNGVVTQFLGSQTSHGPQYVNLPNDYWTPRLNLPGVQYLQICLPD